MTSSILKGAALSASLLLAGSLNGCATHSNSEADQREQQAVSMTRLLADTVVALDRRYSPGSIASLDMADQALEQSDAGEDKMQAWYAVNEKACNQRFFVNSCLHDLKVQRRAFKTVLQRIGVEAKAFQRKQRIEQLDKNLEERQSQEKK